MNNKMGLIGKRVMKDLIIDEYIGSGGFGDVYKAYSILDDIKLYCAVKHIVIPKEREYNNQLITMNNDRYATDEYFRLLYKDVVNEINLMYQLSGRSPNIIAYQHYDIDGHKGEPKQYEIFIKMEYLTSLDKYRAQKDMTLGEVLNMRIDIASALDVGHSENIMHRDIRHPTSLLMTRGYSSWGILAWPRSLLKAPGQNQRWVLMHTRRRRYLILMGNMTGQWTYTL